MISKIGTIQGSVGTGSSRGTVEIMLMDATDRLERLGGGGRGKVPISEESLRRPTPTFS